MTSKPTSKRQNDYLAVKVVGTTALLFSIGVGMYYLTQPTPEDKVVIPFAVVTPHRATLDDVRRDWGIEGRLSCRVIPQGVPSASIPHTP